MFNCSFSFKTEAHMTAFWNMKDLATNKTTAEQLKEVKPFTFYNSLKTAHMYNI